MSIAFLLGISNTPGSRAASSSPAIPSTPAAAAAAAALLASTGALLGTLRMFSIAAADASRPPTPCASVKLRVVVASGLDPPAAPEEGADSPLSLLQKPLSCIVRQRRARSSS